MKYLFGGLVLIFIFFLNEIETADNLEKVKTKYTVTSAKLGDEVLKDDHRKVLVLGTPARLKKTRGYCYTDFVSKPDLPDPTGQNALHLFLNHYREKGLPYTTKESLDLYNEKHAGGSYNLPQKQDVSMNQRYKEARRKAFEPLVQQHHQQMFQQHQDFQDQSRCSRSSFRGTDLEYQNQHNVGDQSGGSGLGSGNNQPITLVIGTPAPPEKPHDPCQKPCAAHGPCYSDFLVMPDLPDRTGQNAHNLFLNHYREKSLPNTPKESLDLYNERHAGGSYQLPKEQGSSINKRYNEARKRASEPFIQQHHQQMYQQHQDSQDHSKGSRSSMRSTSPRNKNQSNAENRSGGSGLGPGNNHSYTAPPVTSSGVLVRADKNKTLNSI